MIRPARAADTQGMTNLIHRAHKRSIYSTHCGIDPHLLNEVLVSSQLKHGRQAAGGTYISVAENGGVVTGMIVGVLFPVYYIGDRLTATDLFWISQGGQVRDAMELMRGFVQWSWSAPLVVEVICATNTVILDDPAAAGRILERLGFEQTGNIYRKERT